MTAPLGIFLVAPPGLEPLLADEAREAGFDVQSTVAGGVLLQGAWPDVWRANLMLRGATRVLVRLAEFRALHLAQLDKRARKLPWSGWLRPDIPFRVEAACRKSRIYHAGAAAQRVERAAAEALGAGPAKDAAIVLKVRIEDDLCTISVDTSGPLLHRRGHKQAVNKAPMRETLAALVLRACGYEGTEPVYDPMCGSGTFVIEAAEIAARLAPGRNRHFAFESLATYDADTAAGLRATATAMSPGHTFHGSDRDAGAVRMSLDNADRAGVAEFTRFAIKPIADAAPPDGPPGLVIVNPPYGGRIGNKKPLYGLYAGMGEVLASRFRGWRVGIVTSEAGLARATGLPFRDPGPFVDHGGTKIRLWQTGPLG
ncbi:MAG: class I SAM-dependent RNA methyltransferase [Rhodobacter sp.]|nr:class I SAM-dependent RNA methyltransferase [Rhodobacter sp.]